MAAYAQLFSYAVAALCSHQVDFNVSVLRNSQLGPGIWDDALLDLSWTHKST